MILARFVYESYIVGDWTEVNPNGPMMVPNPKYADRLLGVEFKTTPQGPAPQQKSPHGRAYKFKEVPNGQ